MNSVANLSMIAQSSVGEIAFIDLRAQQRRIRDRIEARLSAILDHGRYIAGPEIDELEAALAARTGAKSVIACASGTAALIIPLLAAGIGEGDAVFVPAFTYNATANAILLAGATPVFVDVDAATFNMDVDDLTARLARVVEAGTLRPAAIMPVDLFGAPADYARLRAVAERHGLFLLSDAAQSFGGTLNGVEVGNLAPATATSFFPGKALGAYGDAGAVFGQSADQLEEWASIRWHGTDTARKNSVRVGFNGRMDTFQAAVLLEKLAIFDDEREARAMIAGIYDQRLDGKVIRQAMIAGARSGYGYYSIRVDNRDAVRDYLGKMGVPTAIYYQTPLHDMPAFADYAPSGGLPQTEKLSRDILSIPMHPYLTPDQAHYVCDVIEAALAR